MSKTFLPKIFEDYSSISIKFLRKPPSLNKFRTPRLKVDFLPLPPDVPHLFTTHLKIMIEECQDDGGKREDEENSKCREGETNFEEIHERREEDCKRMTVQDRQK